MFIFELCDHAKLKIQGVLGAHPLDQTTVGAKMISVSRHRGIEVEEFWEKLHRNN
jgi:hypothetical protein